MVNLTHMEHVLLLATYLITKGDCTVFFTRENIIIYAGLFGWGGKYNRALVSLVSNGFMKREKFPPNNTYFYTITSRTLDYLDSLSNVQLDFKI